jgi:hypothetical protein
MYTLVFLLLVYVALYLLVPELPITWRMPGSPPLSNSFHVYEDSGGELYFVPDYHGIPEQFFAPLYFVDRYFIRKKKWDTTLRDANYHL